MAATAHIFTLHGVSSNIYPGSQTDVLGSSIYFRLDDTDTVDSSSPIDLPASGENFSWRKTTIAYWSTSPVGAVSNLRWFCAGVASGIGFYVHLVSTYTQASSGDAGGLISGMTDATVFTGASPFTVNLNSVLSNPNVGASDNQPSGTVYSTGTGTGAGHQDLIEMQGSVKSTYTGGSGGTTWTVTYRYAES